MGKSIFSMENIRKERKNTRTQAKNGILVQLNIDKFGMNAMEITNASSFVTQDAT